MGTYATTTSLQTTMIGTTFDTATTSLATKCIVWAENEINKYISKRYDVSGFMLTSTAVPPLLTSLCEQLAEGYMYMRSSRGGKESLARGKDMIKEARSNLEMLQSYQVDLVNTSGSVVSDMSNTAYRIHSSTENYSSTFDEDDELSWSVDQDKIDDISDERE